MSIKLSGLKKWLTLEDSAKYLSLLINEDVTKFDLLQLSIQGELKLSVSVPGSHWACPYTASACKKAGHLVKRLERRGARLYTAVLFAQLEYAGLVIRRTNEEGGNLGPDFLDGRAISGVWDLSMFGMERELVSELAGSSQNDTTALTENMRLENNKPIILRHPKDPDFLVGLFQSGETNHLDGTLDEADTPEDAQFAEGLFLVGYDASKTQKLPAGSFLVIRTESLLELVNQLGELPVNNGITPTTDAAQSDLPRKFQQLYGAIAGGELPDLEAIIDAWYSHWNQRAARGERDTYPSNHHIQAWLESRGLSKNKAESIPPLIRPKW